ncbi:MAG: hypothetical protein ABW184_10185 [Sphingobium sp.]
MSPATRPPAEKGVGHLIRNKVGIIVGCVDLLGLTEDSLSTEGAADLARMRRAAQDILEAVAELE